MIEFDDPLSGIVLAGRYEVMERVGGGAMGSVYRARQLQLDREVAVKVLRGEHVESRERRRLHREARAVARIQNPHVVQVHDYGETDAGDPYLVMEMVPGPTISAWLRSAPPSLDDAIKAGAGMLAGLAAAHARGVLHRDLKPANMLLRNGDPNQLVLVDFGIAAVLSDGGPAEERLTREDTVVGTPLYMSPEQALGEPVGPESDLYAAAVVMYEWLSGAPPFGGPVSDVMRSHAFRPAPPLEPRSGLVVPAAVVHVISKALSKARAARYASAGAMREALLAARQPGSIRATPVPTLEVTRANKIATVPSPRVPPPAPFVGRERELAQLQAVFAAVAQGRGAITLVQGPSGVGCSRLCSEMLVRLHEFGVARVGRGTAIGGGAPLAAVRQALEDLLDTRSMGLDRMRARLSEAARRAGGALSEQEAAALVRWLRPESDPGRDGAASWSAALVERFLRVLARERPVVLWLDDLERGGAQSQSWIESIVASQRLDPFPLWLLVTRAADVAEPGERTASGLRESDVVGHLQVAPLTPAALVDLAEALAPLTRQASALIAERAGGLPLVLGSLVRHLIESERLVPIGERLGLADGDDLRDAVPGGLRELWGHRLSSAVNGCAEPELAGMVRDVAAALGPRFAVDSLVEGLTALGAAPSPDTFDGVLDELIASGVFVEVGGAGADELAWEPPSLADMVLERLGTGRRARRRGKELATAFLAWDAPRRAELAPTLVRLLTLVGATDLLPAPALDAGRQALDAGRLGEAERLLDLSSSASAPPAIRLPALESRAEAARLAGRYGDAAAHYRTLLDDPTLPSIDRGRLLVGLGRSRLGARDLRAAAADLTAGIEALGPHLPSVAAARETSRALAALGSVSDTLPDVPVPAWSEADLLGAAASPPDRHVIASSLGYLATRAGDLPRGIALHRTALEASRAAHHRPGVIVALYDLGWTERRAGAGDAALAHLTECQRLAAAYGLYPMLARVHNELGELQRDLGRVEAARADYAAGVELLALTTAPEAWLCVLNLCRLDVEMGAEAAARSRLTTLEQARSVPDWLLGPFSLTLAFCLAGHDDDAARTRMRTGLAALSSSADARAGAAEILDALADRWESADELGGAREARSAAIGLRGAVESR